VVNNKNIEPGSGAFIPHNLSALRHVLRELGTQNHFRLFPVGRGYNLAPIELLKLVPRVVHAGDQEPPMHRPIHSGHANCTDFGENCWPRFLVPISGF
jgi:hypothetical protein